MTACTACRPRGVRPCTPVAGLLITGFAGPEPDEHIRSLIRRGLAGVVLFSRNVSDPGQVAALTAALQAEAAAAGRPPLIVAVDQEGGRVCRVRARGLVFPSAMALGAVGEPREVYALSREIAARLRELGINCNLAPCADVNTERRNPVIGTRSYGDRPAAVAEMVSAAVRGYQDGGVAAVAKHFPGHGAARLDSHLALPVVVRGPEELAAIELVPFRAAISAGVAGVMSAHVVYPEITGDLPATLSREALSGLLRKALGHRGLVFTDCMEMAAVRAGRTVSQATAGAVLAGADLVLWSHTPEFHDEAVRTLEAAAAPATVAPDEEARGELPRRIAESLSRVEAFRQGLAGLQRPPLAGDAASSAARLALRAVTVVGDGPSALPLSPPPSVVAVADLTPPDRSPPAGRLLVQELEARGYTCAWRHVSGTGDVDWASTRAGAGWQVVCLTADAILHPGQAALAQQLLRAHRKAILVATGLPYDAGLAPGAGCRVCIYDSDLDAIRGLAAVLSGAAPASGRLPVAEDSRCR